MTIEGIFMNKSFFNEAEGTMGFYLKPTQETDPDILNDNGEVFCVGKYCLTQRYMPLRIEGHAMHAETKKVEFIIEHVAIHAISLENSEQLLMNLNSSLTRRQIKKILDIVGYDVFAAADTPDIEQTICDQVRGVDEFYVTALFEELRNMKKELEMFDRLLLFNGTYNECTKIMTAFPNEFMDILNNHPYKILENGIVPFDLIDKIALDNGIDPYCEERIQAVLLDTIRAQRTFGHVYVSAKDLYKLTAKKCDGVPQEAVMAALKTHPYIVKDSEHDYYYEASMLKDEKNAARNFARIMRSRVELPWHPEYIDRIEEEQGYKFGGQQREAFYLLKSTGFKLLTGDPGTGKTSTLKGLLRYLEMLWEEECGKEPEFALCAPSGRAAQRMKETTNRVAQTIHKLIEFQPYGDHEYYRDASNPLTADIIVVDESSMMGLSIFTKLISAIKNQSLVIIIGDTNQLQSVDPGSVLQDIIDCGYVDSCHLTETFRQAAGSYININAKRIMQGNTNLSAGDDFEMISCEPDETEGVMLEEVSKLMETVDKNKIQVLAPVKKGTCGVANGNESMQKLMNPKDPEKKFVFYGSRVFREGDRVIMSTNNYSLGYYNGDIGYIKQIGDGSMLIQINDEDIVLPKANYCDMDLAYVVTVHKSQGSEYEYLVVVLQSDANSLLDRNLFYTAVTRGKKKVVVIEENGMADKAVHTYHNHARNTLLAERIQRELACA